MPFLTKARKVNDPVLRTPTARLNKYETQIFNIYNQALSNISKDLENDTVLRNLRAAVEAGNPMDGAIAFRWENFAVALDKTIPKLTEQLISAANRSAVSLPKRIRISPSFTGQDPRAIAWAQQRAGARILGITQESQKAVAKIITKSLRTQLKRDEVIDQITKVVGLDVKQATALGNFYEKNLNNLLEEGLPYEDAVRRVTKLSNAYRKRLLIQRATRIARTETVAAANAGRFLSWSEADAQGLLPAGSQKRWKTAQDERVCPICGPLHNLTIGWEEAFPTGGVMPDNHPNCRCTAVIVPADPVFEKFAKKSTFQLQPWWVIKHAPGKHDQKTHAGGRGGKVYADLQDFLADEDAKWSKMRNPYAKFDYLSETVLSQMEGGKHIAREHEDAVARYQGNTGYKINEVLRDPQISDEGYRKQIDSLDAAIQEASALKEPLEVFRGVASNVGRDNEFWSKMEVGDVFQDDGFVSTSLDPKIAGDFAFANALFEGQGFVFRMTLPAGTKGLFPLSVLRDNAVSRQEAEFILPRGSKFEILSKEGKVWELGLVNA